MFSFAKTGGMLRLLICFKLKLGSALRTELHLCRLLVSALGAENKLGCCRCRCGLRLCNRCGLRLGYGCRLGLSNRCRLGLGYGCGRRDRGRRRNRRTRIGHLRSLELCHLVVRHLVLRCKSRLGHRLRYRLCCRLNRSRLRRFRLTCSAVGTESRGYGYLMIAAGAYLETPDIKKLCIKVFQLIERIVHPVKK